MMNEFPSAFIPGPSENRRYGSDSGHSNQATVAIMATEYLEFAGSPGVSAAEIPHISGDPPTQALAKKVC